MRYVILLSQFSFIKMKILLSRLAAELSALREAILSTQVIWYVISLCQFSLIKMNILLSRSQTRLGAELCAPWAAIYPLDSGNPVVECSHVVIFFSLYQLSLIKIFVPSFLLACNIYARLHNLFCLSLEIRCVNTIQIYLFPCQCDPETFSADKLEYFVGTIPHGRIPTSI